MSGSADDGLPEVDIGRTCSICGRILATLAGRRVHERRAHPEAFHDAESRRLVDRPKARWDPEEVALMVAFEKSNPQGRLINQAIQREVFPHRTQEGIKGKMRSAEYKCLIQAEVREPGPASAPPPALPPAEGRVTGDRPSIPRPGGPPTPSEPPGHQEDADATPEVGSPPPPLPANDLTSEEEVRREVGRLSRLLGVEIPQDIEDLQNQLDVRSPPRLVAPRPADRPPPPMTARRRALNIRGMLKRRGFALF